MSYLHQMAERRAAALKANGFPISKIVEVLNAEIPEQFIVSGGRIFRKLPKSFKWQRTQEVVV